MSRRAGTGVAGLWASLLWRYLCWQPMKDRLFVVILLAGGAVPAGALLSQTNACAHSGECPTLAILFSAAANAEATALPPLPPLALAGPSARDRAPSPWLT